MDYLTLPLSRAAPGWCLAILYSQMGQHLNDWSTGASVGFRRAQMRRAETLPWLTVRWLRGRWLLSLPPSMLPAARLWIPRSWLATPALAHGSFALTPLESITSGLRS